jgi:hypothetical protein
MRRSITKFLAGGALVVPALQLVTSSASAGIEPCGGIEVSASAQCEVLVEGGCVAQCEPIRFLAAWSRRRRRSRGRGWVGRR